MGYTSGFYAFGRKEIGDGEDLDKIGGKEGEKLNNKNSGKGKKPGKKCSC